MFAVNSLFRGGFYSIFICSNKTQTRRQVIDGPNNIDIKRNVTPVNSGAKENKKNSFNFEYIGMEWNGNK